MTFKLTAIAIALIATSQAHAVFNVYNSNGTKLDIHGEINLNLHNKSDTLQDFHENRTFESTDKQTRFGNDSGSSWIEFHGSQTFGKDYRVTGVMGYGYKNVKLGNAQDTTFVAIDKKNVGSIALGRQYLHTGYVMKTGTYSVLDDYGYSIVRADFTKIPGLHVSGYYNLPDSIDVRQEDGLSRTSGKGVSFSYVKPLADDHSIRVAGGYSTYAANVDEGFEAVLPKTQTSYAGSLEYKKDRLTIAADFGKSNVDHRENILVDKGEITVIGGKIGYAVNPQINVAVGYGVETYKRTGGLSDLSIEDLKAELPTNPFTQRVELIHETETSNRLYVRGDYYARENVRFYARYDQHDKKGVIRGDTITKENAPEYRIGVALSF